MSGTSLAAPTEPTELPAQPVWEEVLPIGRAFADTPDDEEAHALLADHPEIRIPELVAVLVNEARSGDVSDEEAKRLSDRAALLCGLDWPDGPTLATDLVNGMPTVVLAVPERAALDRLVDVARRVSGQDVAEAVPPGMLAGLLTTAARVLLLARHYSDDPLLLDEAVTAARRAVEAMAGEGPLATVRSLDLAAACLAKFDVTGERALLEEAFEIHLRAAKSVPVGAFERPGLLDGLASSLHRLYLATGRGHRLRSAVSVGRHAVALAESAGRAAEADGAEDDGAVAMRHVHQQALHNLATYLTSGSYWPGHRAELDEAVTLHRRALDGTPDGNRFLPARLNGLAMSLRRGYEMRGDRELLEEAVAVQRRAVEVTPADGAGRNHRTSYLAELLADLAATEEDTGLLEEAWAMVEQLEARTPFGRAVLAWAKAHVVRRDERRRDRFTMAARELGAALAAVEELRDSEPNPVHQRDLAYRFNGLLGDLIVNVALSGNVERAVELIEAERIWLPAPPVSATGATAAHPPVPVVWVASSQWETVAISTTDHSTYTLRTIASDRNTIYRAITTYRAVAPAGADASDEERQQSVAARCEAVNELCSLATDIAEGFPQAVHLLVVPVGDCALLPYAAARRGDGYLVDETALTVAPSLAWARAAHRPRPDGPGFAAFHPGSADRDLLPLDRQRRTFQKLFDAATILDRPTAEDVLGHFDRNVDIGHFFCHGTYSPSDPFEKGLELETALTLRAVLDQPASPWLVNLSACGSAICDYGASEQQIGLPTAFLRAGAAHVRANLWEARADLSDIVDAVFYRHLARGAHPAVALRHAVCHLRDFVFWHDRIDLHPYRWAPFIHFGSATPLEVDAARRIDGTPT